MWRQRTPILRPDRQSHAYAEKNHEQGQHRPLKRDEITKVSRKVERSFIVNRATKLLVDRQCQDDDEHLCVGRVYSEMDSL